MSPSVDTVRASRDGHEFHEAWTARKALQLLLPGSKLAGIAVEGLSPPDQKKAASETVAIADIVLYYGARATFRGADSVKIVQFKYSVSSREIEFRNSHAKQTIIGFAKAFRDYRRNYGAQKVRDKLTFELITNRPIYPALKQAISRIADKKPLSGEVGRQADQFRVASELDGRLLVEFASKCRITGLAGHLGQNKGDLKRTLVNWHATSDPVAMARLGAMRQLVRDKAGTEGHNKNVIRHTDILAALDIQDEDDLFPCPTSFPKVGAIVNREQLAEAITLIPRLDKPLLIHAAGGVGKTVFMESLAKAISKEHETLLFDCFGGGRYRAPEDSRHLPTRGLIHIVNVLACSGLCDPLLPGTNNQENLIRTLRRRLSQCVDTLKTASPERELVLFIDAIDNAAVYANDRGETAFPKLLLNSFHHGGQIPGVHIVVSCRTHRREVAKGDTDCFEFELRPFSHSETKDYLCNRLKRVTQAEVQVAQARSGGNPRILEHLVSSDRGLLDESEIENTIELDELLTERIEKALSKAFLRGYTIDDTNAFLAGLSVLPPPVPIDEYADAHGMEVSDVKSFAADLAPLLEHTKFGLMFRDEPTETLIREKYASDLNALRRVAESLLNLQDSSVYAARALPELLQKLNDGDQLFQLAFNESFPGSVTSTVGRRNIRDARVRAALLHAAHNQDHDRLVHLMVEMSTIAAGDARGTDYIVEYPDLVIAAHDVDATRRLFEIRTIWQGTRHARLTIAHTLSGDFDEAFRHAIRADEWIYHFYQQDEERTHERSGPDQLDIAAVPFCLIAQDRAKKAVSLMKGWSDGYAYEVSEHLFRFVIQVSTVTPRCDLNGFLNGLKGERGIFASALSFLELDDEQRRQLIKKLAKASRKRDSSRVDDSFYREKTFLLRDGLLKASAMATSIGLTTEALAISRRIAHKRPYIHSFLSHFSYQDIFPFLARTALISAIKSTELRERDILPKELDEICYRLKNTNSDSEFRKKLVKRLESFVRSGREQMQGESNSFSREQENDAKRFITNRLGPLLELTKAFASLLGTPIGKSDGYFLALLEVCAETRKLRAPYGDQGQRFFELLGSRFALFALWLRNDLKKTSVVSFLNLLHEREILGSSALIDVVTILSSRDYLHELAGQEAVHAKSLIDKESDVSYRASLYAQLARAILPASRDEAAAYFRAGLEQMDAIGSGDYEYVDELFQFASTLKKNELEEQDFHTLVNICELNIPDESEKFPWFTIAKGASKAFGCKGLAKLGRWDDRSQVSLDYTLLPYLTALIDHGKIAPEIALALMRLSSPAELFVCDTTTFAQSIVAKSYPNTEELIGEVIKQFEDNDSRISEALVTLAKQALGESSETATYLSAACEHFDKVRHERNKNLNQDGLSDIRLSENVVDTDDEKWARPRELAAGTVPLDEGSIEEAVNELNELRANRYGLIEEFFESLRAKLEFSNRSDYIRIVAQLNNLSIYKKLAELKKCKEVWTSSSTALALSYERIAAPIVQLHAEDFVHSHQLWVSSLKEVSNLSEVPMTSLALELIKTFASPAYLVPGPVWLGLASIVVEDAEVGVGQTALTRLLRSDSAKLSSNVIDGAWKDGMYPLDDQVEIAAGLVWFKLGAPSAAERWRAAHSVRCFAKFGKWKVIDALVARFDAKDAYPFQAPELQFYFLHARLWLLIALARLAIDHPKEIAKYESLLKRIVLDDQPPHVLMRHFAAQAILECVDRGGLVMKAKEKKKVQSTNLSPFPRLKEKLRNRVRRSIYRGRPDGATQPDFYLDYDFEKYDVDSLGSVFGISQHDVKNILTECVHLYDPDATNMYDDGGRESRRDYMGGMSSAYHTYGQQLGWHGLFLVASRLLSEYPVTEDSYQDEPWFAWLRPNLLTRKDGLWLSDGMDRPPLQARVNLLEQGKDSLVITGDKAKLLRLVKAESGIENGIVVDGQWNSIDGITVYISSALVAPRKAKSFIKRLIEEKPFFAHIPSYQGYGDSEEHLRNEESDCEPWIVVYGMDSGLDGDDPLGATDAVTRPRLVDSIARLCSITSEDPFGRVWKNAVGETRARSDAWGLGADAGRRSDTGVRLVCSAELIREVLSKRKSDLVVLINLQRYEEGSRNCDSKFSNTVAVLRIKDSLTVKFHSGAVNCVNKSRA